MRRGRREERWGRRGVWVWTLAVFDL